MQSNFQALPTHPCSYDTLLVSKRWCAVFYSTPALWRRLQLPPYYGCQTAEQEAALLLRRVSSYVTELEINYECGGRWLCLVIDAHMCCRTPRLP